MKFHSVLVGFLGLVVFSTSGFAGPSEAYMAVSKKLTPAHAVYLYESLNRQMLITDEQMEKAEAGLMDLLKDSYEALEQSIAYIMVGRDGETYLDIPKVSAFYEDVIPRYLSATNDLSKQEVTKENRKEQLSAWYSFYMLVLVSSATGDEMAKALGEDFERSPESGLVPGGPSLADQMLAVKTLSDADYAEVHVTRETRENGKEYPVLPKSLEDWKAKIQAAYQ